MAFIIGFVFIIVLGIIMFHFLKKKPAPTAEDGFDKQLRDSEAEIAQFKKKVEDLTIQRNEQNDELQYLELEVSKWVKISEKAAETKKKENVVVAVRTRMEAEQKRDNLAGKVKKMTQVLDGLSEQLRFAEQKIEDAKSSRTTLDVRISAAKIREHLESKSLDLTAIEDEAIKHEATAEAYEETSPQHQEFLRKNVVQNMDVDNEVDRLMGKTK